MTDYITRADLAEILQDLGRTFDHSTASRIVCLNAAHRFTANAPPPPVEPTNPQSLREKWQIRIGEWWRHNTDQAIEHDFMLVMLDDLHPEDGPPLASEMPNNSILQRFTDGTYGFTDLSVEPLQSSRWPARKP